MHRYKQDAAYELQGIESRIASNKKSAETTANAKTARIADAVLPSLMRRAAELRAEIETLPDRPPYAFAHTNGNFPCLTRVTPFTDAELAELEVPKFLSRQ